MFTPQDSVYLTDAKLNPGDNSLLGKTISVNLPRDWPIEYVILRVWFVTTGTALTLFPATAQTPDNYDNVMNLLKHITLTVNPGNGLPQRNVVDCDGVRLLEYNALTAFNLDESTLNMLQLSQGTTVAASTAFQLTYLIPCAELMVSEGLRSRLYLPVHRHTSDPKLTLTFQSLANIASAGGISTLGVVAEVVRRRVTPQSEAILQRTLPKSPWGYVDWDLIEQDFAVASSNAQQSFDLALGASYLNMLISQYLGGTNITRNTVDGSGIGDTVAHGLGQETQWSIATSNIADRVFRFRDLAVRNQMSCPRNNITQSSSPAFGGPVITNTNYRAASSVLIDFLRDGISGDPATELGSVLNCNLQASQKKQLIGVASTFATNASQISVMGRRLFGDLSPWQKIS